MSDPSPNYASDHLRTHDFTWYVALQFAPAGKRRHLMALFAYLAEMARVRSLVTDPMPGEMRLQWWRDALQGTAHGSVEANPLAAELFAAIEALSLPSQPLLAVLDGRTADLYDDPMPDETTFEGYAGEIWSGPMAMAVAALSGEPAARFADVAGHGGVALTVARALASFPTWAARGQCLVPATQLAAAGLKPEDLRQTGQSAGLAGALRAFATYGLEHLGKAQAVASTLPQASHSLLLPLALARGNLQRAQGAWSDAPTARPLEPARWQIMWQIWRASRRMPNV
ncbi:MAG: squalene/phytoene synthase family protein [Devosiaceae bacterium]|nr:squalene/phytoene synthase family protein [Devosiaceae bacterium MH13]